MADLPPLPPGFQLDVSASGTPPLPPGFTLDSQQTSAAPAAASPSLAMAPIGGAEMLYSGATGAVASIPAAVAYAGTAVGNAVGLTNRDPADVQRNVQSYFTHSPVTESGRAGAETFKRGMAAAGNALDLPEIAKRAGEFTDEVSRRNQFAGHLLRATPGAFQAASSLVPAASAARGAMVASRAPYVAPAIRNGAPLATAAHGSSAEDILAANFRDTPQSMGAAASAPNATNLHPELRQAVEVAARRTGGAINQEAFVRHADSYALPVPIRLTEGQASGDVALLSHEQNMRARVPQFAERFNEQNRALGQNMQAIRDEVGPNVFSANHVEHGDTLINAYRTMDTARETQINKAYADLRAAAGGNFPIGANTLLANASQELHKKLIFDHAPKSVMKALGGFATKPGSMTFENFEALRTNLATIQRTATDGLERKAAGIIRRAMEDLPLVPGAAKLKPLADNARRLARERFAAIEADPAYTAVIEDSVPPDRFVQKFITGGTRDNLALMRSTIGNDESAAQTMGVAALDYLRDQARLSPSYEGNFATASYAKALQRLSPSMRSLLPARAIEQLEALGRVAGYTTAQPRGSFVNNSNTFTAAAADTVKSSVEGVANVAAAGVPVGTWIRKGLEGAHQRRAANRAMAPGAGLGRLTPQERQ